MNEKKLYIDIDGVLLGSRLLKDEIGLAEHAKEFINYAIKHFDCYWLTTHCRDGKTERAAQVLRQYCDKEFIELIKPIKAAAWLTLKTDAIDMKSDFYWIEDRPMQAELDVLEENGLIDRWIYIDTRSEPEDLDRLMKLLKAKL